MGYVTRYVQGTDKLRRNGFEVRGMNGINSSIVHCDNVKSLPEWVKLISENIANLSEIQVKTNLFYNIGIYIVFKGVARNISLVLGQILQILLKC